MSPYTLAEVDAFEQLTLCSEMGGLVRFCNHEFLENTRVRHLHKPGLYISMLGVCHGETLNDGMDRERDYSHQYMVTIVDQECSGEMQFRRHSIWQTLSIMLPLDSLHEAWRLPEFQANFSHSVPQIRLAELGPIPRDILRCCEAIWECDFQGPERHLFIRAKAQEALALFIHHRRQAYTKNTHNQRSEQIFKALDYIQQNLHREWNLAAVAKLAGTNKTYIKQDIKNHLGVSFQQWLRAERLGAACEQMATLPHLSISDIAANVGFNSQAHFATCFKAEHGITPTEYRQSLVLSSLQ